MTAECSRRAINGRSASRAARAAHQQPGREAAGGREAADRSGAASITGRPARRLLVTTTANHDHHRQHQTLRRPVMAPSSGRSQRRGADTEVGPGEAAPSCGGTLAPWS